MNTDENNSEKDKSVESKLDDKSQQITNEIMSELIGQKMQIHLFDVMLKKNSKDKN